MIRILGFNFEIGIGIVIKVLELFVFGRVELVVVVIFDIEVVFRFLVLLVKFGIVNGVLEFLVILLFIRVFNGKVYVVRVLFNIWGVIMWFGIELVGFVLFCLFNWFEYGVGIVGRVIFCGIGILIAIEVIVVICEIFDDLVGVKIVVVGLLFFCSEIVNVVIGCEELEMLIMDDVFVELIVVVCEIFCVEVEIEIGIVGLMFLGSEFVNVVIVFEGFVRKLVECVFDVIKEDVFWVDVFLCVIGFDRWDILVDFVK